MNIPTKDEVEAAQAEEKRLWELRLKAQEAIRAAAGPDLCAAEMQIATQWNQAYTLSKLLEGVYVANGGQL